MQPSELQQKTSVYSQLAHEGEVVFSLLLFCSALQSSPHMHQKKFPTYRVMIIQEDWDWHLSQYDNLFQYYYLRQL